MTEETYIGDGLYASHDGYQFRLRAPREGGDHEVFLDDQTVEGFLAFMEKTFNLTIAIQRAPAGDAA